MKKIFSIFLAMMFLCLFNIFNVFANDASLPFQKLNETDLKLEYFENEKGEVYISGFSGNIIPDAIIIPSEINGLKVTGINNREVLENGDGKFVPVDLKGIKHLIINEGIEKISCMFIGAENLETVTLPKSLTTIASYAFAGAEKLQSINLDNVIAIGSFAFQDCKSLTKVNLAIAEKVGLHSFDGIDNLIIYGNRLSAAETYAKANKVYYVRLPEDQSGKTQITVDGNVYYGLEGNAMMLYKLGLVKGVGVEETGKILFDLERTPTRVEAITMLVRLLGAEEKAVNMSKTHPFTDVPQWADGYVSYAYENGLTNGVSETLFDSDSVVAPEMYLTFMLRALGYDDSSNYPDFSWDNPWTLAREKGITERGGYYEIFLRKEMVDMSYNTLFSEKKDTNKKLYEELIENNVFTNNIWEEVLNYELKPLIFYIS